MIMYRPKSSIHNCLCIDQNHLYMIMYRPKSFIHKYLIVYNYLENQPETKFFAPE